MAKCHILLWHYVNEDLAMNTVTEATVRTLVLSGTVEERLFDAVFGKHPSELQLAGKGSIGSGLPESFAGQTVCLRCERTDIYCSSRRIISSCE